MEAAIGTPGPMPMESQTHGSSGAVRRRRRTMQSVRREDVSDEDFLGIEASLLQS
ncbi:hypothetical protein NDU88_004510, partial [Pleurodeles waltl]